MLGPDGVAPSHSKFSWAAMLFFTGIGCSLIYWGAAEWAFHYVSPPFGVEPRSEEAVLWASSYGMFHWGLQPWLLYVAAALSILGNLEELIIIAFLPKWTSDVRGLYWVLKMRKVGAA